MAEVAIIATDLAELLGSAIALCMLFPALQMWHGVLITSFDVIFLLAMKDPLSGRPARMFEGLVAILVSGNSLARFQAKYICKVLAVLICICIVISKVDVHWSQAFQGFLPSKEIFRADGLYTGTTSPERLLLDQTILQLWGYSVLPVCLIPSFWDQA
jgi:metal iron transporter